MENKRRYLVIGPRMDLAVCHAVAETNVAESATGTQPTGTDSVGGGAKNNDNYGPNQTCYNGKDEYR